MKKEKDYKKNWLDFEHFKTMYQKVPVVEYPNNVLNVIPEPKVSVHIITYQHANYIRQAIDSVLMQKTNFHFEVIIGDDDSTDGTREICIEYAEKYPEQIRLFLHQRENNIKVLDRPSHLFQYTYNSFNLRGEYIAVNSGDDYWTDEYKLQKQVDFLEANIGYSMCFTDYYVVNEDSEIINNNPLDEDRKRDVGLLSVLGSNSQNCVLPPTQTVVLRKIDLLNYIPEGFLKSLNEDLFLFSIFLQIGDAAYLNFKSACYRHHEGSINSSKDIPQRYAAVINTRKQLLTIFKGQKEISAIHGHIKYSYKKIFNYHMNNKAWKRLLKLNMEIGAYNFLFLINVYCELLGKAFKKKTKKVWHILTQIPFMAF